MWAIGTMLHTTGGTNSSGYLKGKGQEVGNPVSAHALIARNGHIELIVPFVYKAFHAGVSRWRYKGQLLEDLNNYFFGIEVEAEHNPLQLCTEAQYISAAALHTYLSEKWKYPITHAIGHYQGAVPLGRKSDPLGFAWGAFWQYVYAPTFDVLLIKKELETL